MSKRDPAFCPFSLPYTTTFQNYLLVSYLYQNMLNLHDVIENDEMLTKEETAAMRYEAEQLANEVKIFIASTEN